MDHGACSCRLGRDCKTPAKHPATKHGFKDATCDPSTVEEFWTNDPDLNIGIATGRLSDIFVVDLDGTEGIEAFDVNTG